jgi:predicted TIM-barrel fold metal-dependent hydrolase
MPEAPHRIDVHHHQIPDLYRRALSSLNIGSAGGRDLPTWSASTSLGVMDAHGIECAVLSVSTPGTHFGDVAAGRDLARRCNEFSAELVAAHPKRFGFFATVPLPDVDGATAEAVHALDELAADGVVLLSSNCDGSYLGDPRFDGLMAELDRRHAVVFVHPAEPSFIDRVHVDIPAFAMEFTFDTTRAAFNLVFTGTAERYPNIRYILSHAGGAVPYLVARFDLLWFTDDALAERAPRGGSAYLRDMYYDTALSANAHALSSLSQLVGADHVLFGSDYPFAPEVVTAMTVDGLARSAYDAEALAGVERTNALRLMPTLSRRLDPTTT